MSAIIEGILSLFSTLWGIVVLIFGLVVFVFGLWIASMVINPVLSAAPSNFGTPISSAMTIQDGADLAVEILGVAGAIGSAIGTAVTKSPYFMIGVVAFALIFVFAFAL